jgi:polyphenol oxidase
VTNDATTATQAWRRADGLEWLEWSAGGARVVFPTRAGGVSAPPYDSLNLGLSTDDTAEAVIENRRRLCAAVGLPLERLVVPGQVHDTVVREVGAGEAGRGTLAPEDVIPRTDALFTRASGLGLAVSYADCVPVAIVAADAAGFATVHAGWRGMVDGIVGKAAAELARGGRLIAGVVGPSIGPCCFTVGEDVRRRFAERFPGAVQGGSVDLWACARQELEAAGLAPAAVSVTGLCTSCDRRFFSHRREHGLTGRHLGLGWRQEA